MNYFSQSVNRHRSISYYRKRKKMLSYAHNHSTRSIFFFVLFFSCCACGVFHRYYSRAPAESSKINRRRLFAANPIDVHTLIFVRSTRRPRRQANTRHTRTGGGGVGGEGIEKRKKETKNKYNTRTSVYIVIAT